MFFLGPDILLNYYLINLTSHLTSPNEKPLVNSFFDIADTPGVSLTIDKGFAVDKMIQVYCDTLDPITITIAN